MTIAFIDTETTALDRDRREPWDVALIVEGHPDPAQDGEYQAFLRPERLRDADPNSVRFSRMYERLPHGLLHRTLGDEVLWDRPDTPPAPEGFSKPAPVPMTHAYFAAWLCQILDGATVVGAVPSFDEETLFRYVARQGYVLTNHYHLIDVEPLALGWLAGRELADPARFSGLTTGGRLTWAETLRQPPYDSDDIWTALGVQIPADQRHTALGDARQVRRAWRVVTGQDAGRA